MKFPQVSGNNLADRTLTLPDDLVGELNLLLVAFEIYQQADIRTWLPVAAELKTAVSDFAYYELPILPAMNFFNRAIIDSGKRAGIADPTAREATITLYLDRRTFLDALKLPDTKRIYLLLVSKTGKVIWRTSGERTLAKEASLRRMVDKWRKNRAVAHPTTP